MAVDAKALKRASTLKQWLVEFSHRPQYEDAARDAATRQDLDLAELDEQRFILFWDYFVLEHRLRDGRTVVERFVATRPDLSESDRQMLLGWREVVQGPFEVQERVDDALLLLNLVDDLTYRVRSNAGPAPLRPVSPGLFLMTRIVPIGDEWMLSGSTHLFHPSQRDDVYAMAFDMAMRTPEAVFRNPEKLALAWELQRKDRERFMRFFGGDLVLVEGRDLQRRMDEYWAYAQEIAHRELGKSGVDAVAAPAMELPSTLAESETVAVIHDEFEGLNFYTWFSLVDAAFAAPDLLRQRKYREAVESYLKDDSVAPLVIRRLVERHPATASAVFQRLLKKPKFDWERDGEALLHKYKPKFFDREPRPSVSPISDRLAAYVQRRQ